jgi:hypothetical protein
VVLKCPGSPAGPVLSVGSGAGSVVLLEPLVVELVGGSVVLVGGGPVVGGAVLLGGWRRGLVDGGALAVVEVVALLLGGTITARLRAVVDGLVELAGETSWRGRKVLVVLVVLVVVVCAVALATWPGEVTKPTMLPPIAPISIAVTTLTQRRAATNEIGRNPEPPRFELPDNDDKRQCPTLLEHPRTDTPLGAARPPRGTMVGGGAGPPPEARKEAR